MHGLIVHQWAGERRAFRLAVTGHFILEHARGDDAWTIFERFRNGEFRLLDVQQVLYVGLIGAGENPAVAESVTAGVGIRKFVEAWPIAYSIMLAAFIVPPGDEEEAKAGASDGEKPTLGSVYRNAFAIGIKPREVDQMSMWEYGQCVGGWSFMHGGEESPTAPKQDELDELMAKYS